MRNQYSDIALADLRGGARDAPPQGPNSFIFMQFSVKIGQNSRLEPPPGGLAPPPPPVWEILDPPLHSDLFAPFIILDSTILDPIKPPR